MTHLDDGTLQAFLDDELGPDARASVAEHLLGCDRCQAAHEAVTRASALFTQSASVLDVAPATRVRPRSVGQGYGSEGGGSEGRGSEGRGSEGRGSERHPSRRRTRARTATVMKAAVLVIAVAAAASAAVPGSPVHEWVAGLVGASEADAPVDPSAGPAAPAAQPAADGVVEGVVRGSADGERLAYARVQVLGDTIADWTDEQGAYRLDGLQRGVHGIEVVHPGHDTLAVAATITDARPVRLDVTLEAGSGPEVDALADFEPIRVEFTLPALLNGDEIADLLQRMYPSDLTGSPPGGETVLWLWLDETGQVVRSAVSSSSGHRALDSIALIVADSMRFRPARRQQDGVRVIVQIPLVFLMPEPAPEAAEGAGQRR